MRKRTRTKRAAAKAPAWMQDVAGTKWRAGKERRQRSRGSFGPASEVRHIEPADALNPERQAS